MFLKFRSIQKISILFFILLTLTTAAISAPSNNETGSGEVVFNPLGFFQFGPMVDIGPRVGNSSFIDFHFRWAYAGLLYQVIESDGFENDVDTNSYGVGIRFTHLLLKPGSPHCIYIGGAFEITRGGSEYSYSDYSSENFTREWKGRTLVFNMGYRWRFPSGFFMQLGGYAGFHDQYEAEITYENGYSKKNPEKTRVIAMLEFSIGTEFGK